MIEGWIKLVASTDGNEWCTFDVTIAKEKIESHINFLDYTDAWKSFGKELILFPQSVSASIVFEAGADNPSDAHISLKAYVYDAQGHAALSVFMDNKRAKPHRCQLEFSIPAEVASINRLGWLLVNWQIEDNSEITWQAQTS